MSEPRVFDLRRVDSSTAESGRRFAPREPSGKLSSVTWILPMLVGILCILLIIKKYFAIRRENEQLRLQWHTVIHTCREHALSPNHIRVFVEFLQRHPRIAAQRATSSLNYFDNVVSTPLRKNSGAAIMEDIRKHLFLKPVSAEYAAVTPEKQDDILHDALASTFEAPAVRPGTRILSQGDTIKLHIDESPEMFRCAVAAVLDDCFIVVLPADLQTACRPEPGQKAEGFFSQDEVYYTFESTIESVSGTKINLCRIHHTDSLIETNRRQFTRMVVRQKLTLHMASQKTLSSLNTKEAPTFRTCEALITDISAGGCALEVDAHVTVPQMNDLVQFQLRLHPNKAPTEMLGKILSVNRRAEAQPTAQETTPVLMHVEFIHTDQKTQDLIEEIIHQQKVGKNRS